MRAVFSSFVIALALSLPSAALDDPAAVDAALAVRDVRARDGAIEATLVNRSGREIRDVRMVIEYVYHWPDEMHPGEDDGPGRAWPHRLPGPIPPDASHLLRFEPPGGLPTAPGTFTPRIEILGFTQTDS